MFIVQALDVHGCMRNDRSLMQAEEAEEESMRMLRIYEEFATKVAAMPVVAGRKSRLESFAGADCTYTIEAMMGDRRALQVHPSLVGLEDSWTVSKLSLQFTIFCEHKKGRRLRV